MIINFLQTRSPPILPALHPRPHKVYTASDGSESSFNDEVEKLRGFGTKNKTSLGLLLFQFFRYYGYEFNYDESVVSVRHGRVLARKEKGWTLGSKDGQWRLCIEEPFNTTRNLGNSADSTAFRGIHLELRIAFLNICKLKLNKMMERYEFPAEEKPVFKRAPVSRAVLSSGPAITSNRKYPMTGGSVRLNRSSGGRGAQSGAAYRRSSSGATFGRSNVPLLSNHIPLNGEFLATEPLNGMQLQHWQMLGKCAVISLPILGIVANVSM
jgi:Cid1 family poly A polymerase